MFIKVIGLLDPRPGDPSLGQVWSWVGSYTDYFIGVKT